jgi:peptidoglycan hydrolase CwlO-like protein
MNSGKIQKALIFSAFLLLFFSLKTGVFSQSATPYPTQGLNCDNPSNIPACAQHQPPLNVCQCPDYLSGQILDLKNQANTLTNQISVMDNQINLTQARIDATQEQLTGLAIDIYTATQKISGLQNALETSIKVLLNRIVATYEVGTIQPIDILLTSGNAADFFTRLNYLKIAQAHDKQLIYNTQQAKVDYSNQKIILQNEQKQVEQLKQQLLTYTDELNQQKQAKQDLLTQTQGNEANYQSLLSQAQAQLAALSNYASLRAGVGGQIIPHQDLSDSWGKYYNQRDANWGNNLIGLSSYQIWEVGCLITSYAMVSSHFGSNITPADVAGNSGNFFSNTAEFNAPGPAAGGHSASYVTNPSLDDLKNDINGGAVVIAGLSANGGPYPEHYSDHWVVLRSVNSDGSFQINDPWYGGAMNVNFNDHYSGWTIIEARIYH